MALSSAGLVLMVVGFVGLFAGAAGATAKPLAIGAALFVVPLVELWARRRARAGKPTFQRLRQLDERVLPRKL